MLDINKIDPTNYDALHESTDNLQTTINDSIQQLQVVVQRLSSNCAALDTYEADLADSLGLVDVSADLEEVPEKLESMVEKLEAFKLTIEENQELRSCGF